MFFDNVIPMKNGFFISEDDNGIVFLLNSKAQAKFRLKIAGTKRDAYFYVTAENGDLALEEIASFCKKNQLLDFYITKKDFEEEIASNNIDRTVDTYAYESGYSKTNKNLYLKLYYIYQY